MATDDIDHQIRSRIDAFLSEVSALVRRSAFESVEEALGDGAAPRRRGPGRPRKKGRRGPGRPRQAKTRGRRAKSSRRVRRSSADIERIAARVRAHVNAHPGQRLEEIGRGLKTDTGVLKRPIAKLLAAKALKTKGQKRGTRYFASGGRGGTSKPRRKTKTKAQRRAKRARRVARKKATRRAAKPSAPEARPAAEA